MFKLTGKIALVTGASQGIGKAIALKLAEAGAQVVCVSRSEEALKQTVADITAHGWLGTVEVCDVTQPNAVQTLVKTVLERLGRIDILVNNAGITRDNLLMRMSTDDWQMVLDVNLNGAFHTIKAVTRPMLRQRFGRIINISSVVGLTGNAGQANYAASKAGLMGLTKATAKELASRGITVNCIAPGYIETAMTADLSEEVKENLNKQIPLGRIGQPDDVGTLVVFLASEEAGYITGQTIAVDGGMTMQ
ncbi:MAG: 3-oxoacyl-[acyl-carrier-protein] reductase [Fidelibacterota bacterium]